MPISDGTKPSKSEFHAVMLAGYTSGTHRAFSTMAVFSAAKAAWRSSVVWAALAAASSSSNPSGDAAAVL